MEYEEKLSALGLDEKMFEGAHIEVHDELLAIHLKIDVKKYKNELSVYSEVLKKYFPKHRIFVLTKKRERKGIKGILLTLFRSSKKAVMSEMDAFTPNFLGVKDDKYVLISPSSEELRIYELPITNNKTFAFRGYLYKVANEIKLK